MYACMHIYVYIGLCMCMHVFAQHAYASKYVCTSLRG